MCFSVRRKIILAGKERKEGKFREGRRDEGRNKMTNMWVELRGR